MDGREWVALSILGLEGAINLVERTVNSPAMVTEHFAGELHALRLRLDDLDDLAREKVPQ